MLFFLPFQLSLDEVFGLWRQMRLYCHVISPADRQIDLVVPEAKRIDIIVTVACHRNDVSPLQNKTRPRPPIAIFPMDLEINTKQNALGPRFATLSRSDRKNLSSLRSWIRQANRGAGKTGF